MCSLYQPALLEGVDNGDEIPRIDAQASPQLLLRGSIQVGEHHHRAVVGWSELPGTALEQSACVVRRQRAPAESRCF